ncbi:MAG: hypothetical protein PHU85_04585, partial [Phycisphaerae bacterium]|nr:hypothetical protein [Phycisphaerae bacterium]
DTSDGSTAATADEAPPDPLLVTETISPEVQWIHLRYYDGSTWSDTYEKGASGPTPLAVEITIGFSPLLTPKHLDEGKTIEDRLKELFGDDATEALPSRSYQTVVYLASGELVSRGGVKQQKN